MASQDENARSGNGNSGEFLHGVSEKEELEILEHVQKKVSES